MLWAGGPGGPNPTIFGSAGVGPCGNWPADSAGHDRLPAKGRKILAVVSGAVAKASLFAIGCSYMLRPWSKTKTQSSGATTEDSTLRRGKKEFPVFGAPLDNIPLCESCLWVLTHIVTISTAYCHAVAAKSGQKRDVLEGTQAGGPVREVHCGVVTCHRHVI